MEEEKTNLVAARTTKPTTRPSGRRLGSAPRLRGVQRTRSPSQGASISNLRTRNVHVEPRCRLGRDFAGRQLQKFSTGARQGRPFAFCTSSNFIAHSLTHPHGCNRMIVAAFTYAQMLHFLLSLGIGRCRHSSGRRRHREVVVVVALVFYRHGLRPKATRTRFFCFLHSWPGTSAKSVRTRGDTARLMHLDREREQFNSGNAREFGKGNAKFSGNKKRRPMTTFAATRLFLPSSGRRAC